MNNKKNRKTKVLICTTGPCSPPPPLEHLDVYAPGEGGGSCDPGGGGGDSWGVMWWALVCKRFPGIS